MAVTTRFGLVAAPSTAGLSRTRSRARLNTGCVSCGLSIRRQGPRRDRGNDHALGTRSLEAPRVLRQASASRPRLGVLGALRVHDAPIARYNDFGAWSLRRVFRRQARGLFRLVFLQLRVQQMSRCATCSNEADLYWDPPEFGALTPEGVVLIEKINNIGKRRMFLCAPCFKQEADKLGAVAIREQTRRSQEPS